MLILITHVRKYNARVFQIWIPADFYISLAIIITKLSEFDGRCIRISLEILDDFVEN